MSGKNLPAKSQFIVCQTEDGSLKIDVRLESDTVWLGHKRLWSLLAMRNRYLREAVLRVVCALSLCVLVGALGSCAHTKDLGNRESGHSAALTLVPPSPVTDKIHLDIRGSVRNDSATSEQFAISLYLDQEEPGSLIERQVLALSPGESGGVYCRWPTEGHGGRHKILCVVNAGSQKTTVSTPVEILASANRSTGVIGGAWVEFYHWSEKEGRLWNAEVVKMTDDDWRESVRAMHDIGMDVIVMEESFRNQQYCGEHNIERDGYKGRAYYPSQLFPGRMPIAAEDPMEAILDEADKLGMSVFVPVGMYAWFDFTTGSLEWHKAVALELYERYGHHPSFYGWYIPEEIHGHLGKTAQRRAEVITFFRELQAYCRRLAPGKLVMLASNPHNMSGAETAWAELLQYMDIICPFGFQRMPEGDMSGEEAAALLQRLCDQAGAHLWMDMETFDFDASGALAPRPVEDIRAELEAFHQFEKVVCYQFTGLMNAPWAARKPGGKETVDLYKDYKDFLSTAGPYFSKDTNSSQPKKDKEK
jgi:hypothetical protein